MATETGTATDYRDLLQKLKAFLTGTGSPESGLNWEVLEERSAQTSPQTEIGVGGSGELMLAAANNDQTHDQIIFKSTGGVSPEVPCYFAIQTYGLSTTGYYNWQLRGLTGFAQNSPITDYVNLVDQPGRSPPSYLMLQNVSMTYWFMGDDRHVKGVIKTGSSYQPFYFGFLNTFATAAEYPYPMMMCGTSHLENRIFSTNAIDASSGIVAPAGNNNGSLANTDPYPTPQSTGWVRFTDGNWYQGKHFYAQGSSEGRHDSGAGIFSVWPLADRDIAVGVDWGNEIQSTVSIDTSHTSTTPGGAPLIQQLQTVGSPVTTLLWPLTVYMPDSNQLLGEFDGCYWCPGGGGLSSEDTITDTGESPEAVNLVFQNVHRTDAWTFMAMRNE